VTATLLSVRFGDGVSSPHLRPSVDKRKRKKSKTYSHGLTNLTDGWPLDQVRTQPMQASGRRSATTNAVRAEWNAHAALRASEQVVLARAGNGGGLRGRRKDMGIVKLKNVARAYKATQALVQSSSRSFLPRLPISIPTPLAPLLKIFVNQS